MRKTLAIGVLTIVCSTANAESVDVNQRALISLRKMCNAVLSQLFPVDMMYVKDFTLNQILNKQSGAVVGLIVNPVNTRDPNTNHACQYDFTSMSEDGVPSIARMLVDMVPVNIDVDAHKAIDDKPLNVQQ
jgi:hypothetical protein